MALTSIEISRLLQPMKDFAPAILRCAEIVQAAEEAERTIAGRDDLLRAIQVEQEDLKRQTREAGDVVQAAQLEAERAIRETAEQKALLSASLSSLTQQVAEAEQALAATRAEHANVIAGQKQELEGVNIVLDQKRKELADFRRAIPKTY